METDVHKNVDEKRKTGYCHICKKRVDLELIQLHRFPKDDFVKQEWIEKIRHVVDENFKYTDSCRACSSHFIPTDYGRKDTNKWRKPSSQSKPKLNREAVPSVFTPFTPRPTNFTSAETRSQLDAVKDEKAKSIVREETEAAAHQAHLEEVKAKEEDTFENIAELTSRIPGSILPENVEMISQNEKASFLKVVIEGKPSIAYSIVFDQSLSCKIWYRDDEVSLRDLLGNGKSIDTRITSFKSLEKLFVILEGKKGEKSKEEKVEEIITEIKELGIESNKISFICEQLSLVLKHPNARRYSKEFLAVACMWHSVSPALYKQIENSGIITIPNHKYARRLTNSITIENELSEGTIAYLKARQAKLQSKDLNINIVLDEVYNLLSTQYVNGTFYGSGLTKTILSVMIKSVAGSYEDIVSMVPIVNISSEKIHEIWTNVVKQTTTELNFNVVATTCDGHKSNMKFFETHLCKGNLKPFVLNPFDLTQKIFLLFDPTHLLKTIYNNFSGKDSFVCPKFDENDESSNPISYPTFNHIMQLHNIEMGDVVKYGHKLCDKVINPLALEKTDVSLATSVFDDSTIAALNYFSKNGFPDFSETAEFLQIVKNWWDVLNVKSLSKGKNKRNRFMRRVDSENIEEVRSYFNKFSTWIKKWQAEFPGFGLSSPTFKALLQTTTAVIDLAEYLIASDNDMGYVLLGFLQQDVLESRFGWWRQLAGGNYYCSTLQFLQAEKIIKLRCLVNDGYNLKEIQDIFQNAQDKKDLKIEHEANHFAGELSDFDFAEHISDIPIIYYVSGYICRGLIKASKCKDCQALFSVNQEPLRVIVEDNGATEAQLKEGRAFVDAVSRGGLIKPSDLVHVICMHASDLFSYIKREDKLRKQLLDAVNSRTLFVEVLLTKMEEQESTNALLDIDCKSKHSFEPHIRRIAASMFNIFAKNLTAEINSKIHESRKRSAAKEEEADKRDKGGMKAKKFQSS